MDKVSVFNLLNLLLKLPFFLNSTSRLFVCVAFLGKDFAPSSLGFFVENTGLDGRPGASNQFECNAGVKNSNGPSENIK